MAKPSAYPPYKAHNHTVDYTGTSTQYIEELATLSMTYIMPSNASTDPARELPSNRKCSVCLHSRRTPSLQHHRSDDRGWAPEDEWARRPNVPLLTPMAES